MLDVTCTMYDCYVLIREILSRFFFLFGYACTLNATRVFAGMVVFVGIAVLCLGALIARYLREKRCQSCECPQPDTGEPGPDTLKITVSYYPLSSAPWSQPHASQIGEHIIQALHDKYGKDGVSVYAKSTRSFKT
jgi:hypothetical protein